MSSLKQSILLVAFYLVAIFVLAQFDYSDSPIIDFAKYFYFAVMVAVPVTVFFPYITKVNVIVPMIIWGSIYFALLQIADRSISAPNTTFAIVLLEFILLLIGVWLAYQLANGISHAESILDVMAIGAFPNRVQDIQLAARQIKLEITRSRRYYRPLCLVIIHVDLPSILQAGKLGFNVQQDLMNRFSIARIGQILDEHLRQTDMIFRDQKNLFVLFCPETNYESALLLCKRLSEVVTEKINIGSQFGTAAFPDDALNFDDLMEVASSRLKSFVPSNMQKETDTTNVVS